MTNQQNYALYFYDKCSQEFSDTPIQWFSDWASAIESAQKGTFWKLCEASASGNVSHFQLIHPVADCLPEIT